MWFAEKLFHPTKKIKISLESGESKGHVSQRNQKALGDLSIFADLMCESWNEVGGEGWSTSLLVSVVQVVSRTRTEELPDLSLIL